MKVSRTASAYFEQIPSREDRQPSVGGICSGVRVIVSVDIPTDRSVNSLRVLLSRYAPRVTMVQTTETRHSYYGGIRCWPLLDGPLVRRVFGERVVHTVLMGSLGIHA